MTEAEGRGKGGLGSGGGGAGVAEEDGVLRESPGESEAKEWRKAPEPRNRHPVLLMIFQ